MSDIKKLFKHSSHYFTGHVLIMLASFISFPILTRVFSVEEYGIFGLVSVTVFILVAISKFGAQYSAVRYYNEYKIGGNEKLTTYYTTFLTQSFLFAFATALLFLLVSRIFSKFISDPLLKDLIWIVAILSITGSLIIRLTNFIRVEQKTKLYNVIEVIRRYSRLGLGLFFVFYFSKTLKYFFSGQILIDVLVISILIYFLFLRNKINFRNFSSSLFKKSIYYGLPLLMMELATLFFRFIDRYLIQFKLTTEALG
ncbi:MAG: lipopolysaccharide biosynthesis protein, partial [Promethearchaeota archaeon]